MNDNNFVQLECKQKHERDTDDDDYDDDYDDDKTNKMVKWSTYEINLSSFAGHLMNQIPDRMTSVTLKQLKYAINEAKKYEMDTVYINYLPVKFIKIIGIVKKIVYYPYEHTQHDDNDKKMVYIWDLTGPTQSIYFSGIDDEENEYKMPESRGNKKGLKKHEYVCCIGAIQKCYSDNINNNNNNNNNLNNRNNKKQFQFYIEGLQMYTITNPNEILLHGVEIAFQHELYSKSNEKQREQFFQQYYKSKTKNKKQKTK